MTSGVRVSCPAKVNLNLRIIAREESGYHQIESVFQGVGLYDRLDLEPADSGVTLSVESEVGDLGNLESNTVVTAAKLFFERTGRGGGVRVHLRKTIPFGTGLGGGSSDAAGTLVGLNRMFGEPLSDAELIAVGGEVGADVPFFCAGAPTALAWGRGGRLLPLPSPPEASVVICVPHVRISTADAYGALSKFLTLPPPSFAFGIGLTSGWGQLGALQYNDFESVVFSKAPGIASLRQSLEDGGAVVARLTGSGSAVFGVFMDHAEASRVSEELEARDGVAQVLMSSTLASGPLNRVEGPR